mmetsp:Transcript_16177/g.37153  ORF Transcript_16177/g.37153 Transcript_16177/m.37153 type:complete len:138 (+) Transcript_16177:186-599(+)|eukprot:CAMPEP_0116844880 /NCGR_PEP_ID=MMETSP0418-20121206/12947_1 /TAXON_ID=1158023 /ORGANISM="Astrosyne radiata, Strain 13vi08-1A" /LENGTH=137 /DNA_ID=CAMNT_0004475909 /DNA_START=184 /DNA_END=597 /DNA_ORIENTATION=-
MVSSAERERICESFREFAHDDEDELPVKGVKHAMKSLGIELKKEEIREAHGDDVMTQETFVTFAAGKLEQQEKAERAFNLIDKDGKGIICFEDLQRVTAELGENMTDEELEEMIKVANEDGLVTKKDLYQVARKVNL